METSRGGSVNVNVRDDIFDPNSANFIAWKYFYMSHAKLEGITEVAVILAEFAFLALIELQIPDKVNPNLLIAHATATSLLIASSIISILISLWTLPYVQTVENMSHVMATPEESPHREFESLINLAWVLSSTVSIFLFVLVVILICWIQSEYFTEVASWCGTAIMFPTLLIICAFVVIFYRSQSKNQYQVCERKCQELEEIRGSLGLRLQMIQTSAV